MCTVSHRPPVDLCLDSNEDRGTRERLLFLHIQYISIRQQCQFVCLGRRYCPLINYLISFITELSLDEEMNILQVVYFLLMLVVGANVGCWFTLLTVTMTQDCY